MGQRSSTEQKISATTNADVEGGTEQSSFIFFPKLPFEIRMKIWNLVDLSHVRRVRVAVRSVRHQDENGKERIQMETLLKTPAPQILYICQESRQEGLRKYAKIIPAFEGNEIIGQMVYIDVKTDTLLIQPLSTSDIDKDGVQDILEDCFVFRYSPSSREVNVERLIVVMDLDLTEEENQQLYKGSKNIVALVCLTHRYGLKCRFGEFGEKLEIDETDEEMEADEIDEEDETDEIDEVEADETNEESISEPIVIYCNSVYRWNDSWENLSLWS